MPFDIGGYIYNGGIADTQDYYNIVNRGLVLHLDASAPSSYPGSGTIWSDISVNTNNGTLTNGPTFNSSNGGSIVLDGTDDYADIPNNSTLNISSHISLEAWIYATSTNTIQNVLSKSSLSQNTGYIYPRTDNAWNTSTFYLFITNSGWSTLSATWPGRNAWHHTIATYDGANMIIYINGAEINSKSQTGTFVTNTNYLAVGQQPGYGEYYGGRIGSIKVYNRALAAAEISQNFNVQRSRFGV
jgi:hypothetical protein